MLHHVPIMRGVSGPGLTPGSRFGVNFRDTLGASDDGPENVFCGSAWTDMVYPTNYTNNNGVSWTAGTINTTHDLSDNVAYPGIDRRLQGYTIRDRGTAYAYQVDIPPDPGGINVRVRLGFLSTRTESVRVLIYDEAGGNVLHDVGPTLLGPGLALNVLGEVTDDATWTSEYEEKYLDVVTTTGILSFTFLPAESPLSHYSIQNLG